MLLSRLRSERVGAMITGIMGYNSKNDRYGFAISFLIACLLTPSSSASCLIVIIRIILLFSEHLLSTKKKRSPSKERDRMRFYMDSLQFNDGTTALERFEEQEQQLHKKLKRGLGR